jgi:hypothetical protein
LLEEEKMITRDPIPIDEAMRECFEDGRYVGREEGFEQARIEIVTSLSKNGIDAESISKFMSLDLSYVRSVLMKNGSDT